ncbi:hypothetical protein [Bradyrhizobium ivorense]|uniref:hypothetical protein n=1 Tax=Bradyrhizobium ivorense TaxID=2511166 RepID=UPI00155AC6CE|nr:hypothetical protein [Bradyrhizobium ivorense]
MVTPLALIVSASHPAGGIGVGLILVPAFLAEVFQAALLEAYFFSRQYDFDEL